MDYRIADILDIPTVQRLMDNLWQASGIPASIIDIDGTVLIATGWPDICTQFHRKHPQSALRCRESDAYLTTHLAGGHNLPECGYIDYCCRNGMIDIGMPIIIEGQHLASFILGGFFYELPAEDFFQDQIQRFDYEPQAYLEALRAVPVFGPEKVRDILQFASGLVDLLASMGLEKLRQLEAKKALQTSEKRFRTLLDGIPDIIVQLSPELHIIWANRAAVEYDAQLKSTLLEGKVCYALWHKRSRPCPSCPALKAFVTGNSEWELVEKGSGEIWELKALPLKNEAGEVVSIIEIARDITDLKRAETATKAALAEAEEARDKIETILNSMTDGLVVTDLAGRIVLMNRMAESMTGTSLAKAFLQPIETVFFEEEFLRQVNDALQGVPKDDLVEWEVKGMFSQIVQARTAAVLSRYANKTGVISILRDVTRERGLDRMKTEFISTAAHELRTPLTAVLGFTEVLLNQAEYGISDPEQQIDFLKIIHEKAQGLERIISDLLDLSRIQSGQLITLTKKACNISQLVLSIVASYEQRKNSHELTVSLPEEPVLLIVDQGKLEQVMENLLSNAFKFSPEGSTIRISGCYFADQFQISVADDGIGMTREQVQRIFDKFYRADASDTAKAGLGLGMSIVKSIVEAHAGRIQVISEVGKGTTVSFFLPVKGEAAMLLSG
ncbi:MAG: PocR ligand-binding domain-containing protein [Desulfuromonadaceae bacterium]